MLERITIRGIPCFGEGDEIKNLGKINFVFGGNGTGKTSISRVLQSPSRFPASVLKWTGKPLEVAVYNRDFVRQNFEESSDLPGIFTLGEENIQTVAAIAAATLELTQLQDEVARLQASLGTASPRVGKLGEQAELDSDLKDHCWHQKQLYDDRFAVAFEGYRNNSERFRDKVLSERVTNTAQPVPLSDLENRAKTLFGPPPSKAPNLPVVDTSALAELRGLDLLGKPIIGKSDVDLGDLITKLQNSDWVRQGRVFLNNSEDKCPFCQQILPPEFQRSLGDYFDESFERDTKSLSNLQLVYVSLAAQLSLQLHAIAPDDRFINRQTFELSRDQLLSCLSSNIQAVERKIAEPSAKIELKDVERHSESLKSLLKSANEEIGTHNRLAENFTGERASLVRDVWAFVVHGELGPYFQTFEKKREGVNKAITSIRLQISDKSAQAALRAQEIRALESKITSVLPTVTAINAMLKAFGFTRFHLAKAEGAAAYRLIRSDGSDARDSLSEGEKTFVTFLYFFHSLAGSKTENGTTLDRLAVLDDPISSLDSDVLFVVSTLVRELCDDARNASGNVRQVIVLTHNILFHKEITFQKGRKGPRDRYWIVRSDGHSSRIEEFKANPISTSYELLWNEVKREDKSPLTLQNSMRRILENYFKILGGIDLDEIENAFDGGDKAICRSLVSWIHEGSHGGMDELQVLPTPAAMENYCRVFREIFKRKGHERHYEMMMGSSMNEPSLLTENT